MGKYKWAKQSVFAQNNVGMYIPNVGLNHMSSACVLQIQWKILIMLKSTDNCTHHSSCTADLQHNLFKEKTLMYLKHIAIVHSLWNNYHLCHLLIFILKSFIGYQRLMDKHIVHTLSNSESLFWRHLHSILFFRQWLLKYW